MIDGVQSKTLKSSAVERGRNASRGEKRNNVEKTPLPICLAGWVGVMG
jgi:hypothetical protein